jgi:manganese/zinc/iron transport system substrate-binding protein
MFKYYLIIGLLFLASCSPQPDSRKPGKKVRVVATTSMITEMISNIGGDVLEVEGLMGAGVDPHLYKASEGDMNILFNADIIFYNGLHLEGKMQDILEKMKHRGIKVIALSDTISKDDLIPSANFASNYDPHIWFDISNWKLAAAYVADKLAESDPGNSELYRLHVKKYIAALDSTEEQVKEKINELPVERRILITAHDAFNYFGRAYQFDVLGLQGISTATEAGVKDVQNMAALIIEKKVKAVFVETSVPLRNIEALKEAVNSKGYHVETGGSLFSDALGNPGTPEGFYTGMFMHNVNTIVNALKE